MLGERRLGAVHTSKCEPECHDANIAAATGYESLPTFPSSMERGLELQQASYCEDGPLALASVTLCFKQ